MVQLRKTAYHDKGSSFGMGNLGNIATKISASKKPKHSAWKELQSINWNWFSFIIGFTCLFSSAMIIVLAQSFGKIQPTDKMEEQNQMMLKIQQKRKDIYKHVNGRKSHTPEKNSA